MFIYIEKKSAPYNNQCDPFEFEYRYSVAMPRGTVEPGAWENLISYPGTSAPPPVQ